MRQGEKAIIAVGVVGVIIASLLFLPKTAEAVTGELLLEGKRWNRAYWPNQGPDTVGETFGVINKQLDVLLFCPDHDESQAYHVFSSPTAPWPLKHAGEGFYLVYVSEDCYLPGAFFTFTSANVHGAGHPFK